MKNRGFFLSKNDQKFVWHPFALPHDENIIIKKAKGVYLIDANNKKYIDAISSWWVNIHGHGNTYLTNSIQKQLRKIDHVIFSGFSHEPAITLAEKLIKKTEHYYSKVFYSDNGSTAVEVALKLAIQFLRLKKNQKIALVSFENAYHGDTFGAMSAGGESNFNKWFKNEMISFHRISLPTENNISDLINDVNALQNKNESIVFIYEPLLQGAGGMTVYSEKLLNRLLLEFRKKESILIADEVLTGFYRTGTFLASNQIELKPDIICLSKAITGGILPLGATLINERITGAFKNRIAGEKFYHGHSYTANPIACAVANASFNLLERKTKNRVPLLNEMLAKFAVELKKNSNATNVHVCGTVLRFEVVSKEETCYHHSLREKIYRFFLCNGILLRPLGNTIYIMPPYTINQKELNRVFEAIKEFLTLKILND